jgi:nucleoside-diphosphate-sugar epimerase
MRIFLAGATGVLGRRIIPLLTAGGHQVTALTRRRDRVTLLESLGARPAVADAYSHDSLAEAVAAAAPDLVMHQLTDLSGGSSADNAVLRIRGTRNLIDAARAAGVQRVVTQSIAWAYQPGSTPAGEDVPLDLTATGPRAVTVRAVAALEQASREIDSWVVLRYGVLYGAGTWYAPGGSQAAAARAGELPATADVASFVHVDDAAAAAVAAIAWPPGAVNICDDEPAPGTAWVPAFCQAVGAPAPAATGSAVPAPWARGADSHHARAELDWAPRYPSWRQGFTTLTFAEPALADSGRDFLHLQRRGRGLLAARRHDRAAARFRGDAADRQRRLQRP